MKAGTPVKITHGTHKGKKGKIGNNRPTNGHQKGKLPVVVGSRNDLYWVQPDWVCENFPVVKEPQIVEQLSAETEIKILEFLRSRSFNTAISDIEIAMSLDISLFQMKKPLQNLLDNGDLVSPLDNQYLLCSQSERSDSSRASADSVEQPNSSEGLNGSNQLNSTTTQCKSCETISTTKFSTETSEAITPNLEPPISTQLAFPAPEQATQAQEPDLTTQSQTSGLNPCAAPAKEDPRSSLLKILKDLSIEDFEQCLEDSEWQAISGTTRSFYKQRKSDLSNIAPGFLFSPTLVASSGKTSRSAGQTKCEKWFKKQEIIASSQCLSAQAMAVISGFPPDWTKSLLGLSQKPSPIDFVAATCTVEPLSPNKPRSHCPESNTCTDLQPGKQWLDPSLILLKEGTQSRDVDVLYETDVRTVQQYAELMAEDLWEWERDPLPIAFLSESGKVYAGDCHHRVSAAVVAKKQICVDLRPGELVDAVLHSCLSNTSHGLPLRPKDQRKRIELFLDTLEKLDEARSAKLHFSIPNLTEIERKNGNWSARVIAKYLKLTESGYRTIINILQEREMIEKFSHFKIGDWVHPARWAEGAIAEIRAFDKRNGVFVAPEIGESEWVHPGSLLLVEKPISQPANTDKPVSSPTSVSEELKQQSTSLGIPTKGLPDVERNEGDPQTLQDRWHSAVSEVKHDKAGVKHDVCATVSALAGVADYLSNAEVEVIWKAIAPRVRSLGLEVKV